MYERFTDRARKVFQLANQEAQRFNHEYIGTEHLLLGLCKEGSGVAANVLKNLDIDLRKIRLEVEKLVTTGPNQVTMGKLPHSPRVKKVIEHTIQAARDLNNNYVGTEHLLLGLLAEPEGVAGQVLINLGLTLETVREEVLNLIGHNQPDTSAQPLSATVRAAFLVVQGHQLQQYVKQWLREYIGEHPKCIDPQCPVCKAWEGYDAVFHTLQ